MSRFFTKIVCLPLAMAMDPHKDGPSNNTPPLSPYITLAEALSAFNDPSNDHTSSTPAAPLTLAQLSAFLTTAIDEEGEINVLEDSLPSPPQDPTGSSSGRPGQ